LSVPSLTLPEPSSLRAPEMEMGFCLPAQNPYLPRGTVRVRIFHGAKVEVDTVSAVGIRDHPVHNIEVSHG
jgi:hypothetical protein